MGNGRKVRHHIVPKSKFGSPNGDNIAFVGEKLHDKYHSLLGNRTPEEVLDFLVNYFWGGKIEYVYKYLEKKGGIKMLGAKQFRRCPHCFEWGYHKIVGGSYRYLEFKCAYCKRLFADE